MSRSVELLRIAKKCFVEQRDVFSTDELVENQITADECYDLSLTIAEAIGFYLDNRKLYMSWKKAKIMTELLKETKGLTHDLP